jgi:hypothetical protein
VYFAPDILTTTAGSNWPAGLSAPVNLPSGWEPLSAEAFGGSSSSAAGAFVAVRHCVQ